MKNDPDKKQEEMPEDVQAEAPNKEEKKAAKELEQVQQKFEDADSGYKRALADYQNLQRRVQADRAEWVRSGNKDLLLRLLPILDTLMLASKHIQDEGLTVSIAQFVDTLKSEGVTRIETVGQLFNPHVMDCVSVVEGEENQVIEELRPGYMIYDRVLRPAQVTVGKKGN